MEPKHSSRCGVAKSLAQRFAGTGRAGQASTDRRLISCSLQMHLKPLRQCRKRQKLPETVIMRASQLDAARLDTELTAMLKEQFMKIFSFFQPRLISALQPELPLILELLVGCATCALQVLSTCIPCNADFCNFVHRSSDSQSGLANPLLAVH